MRRALIAGAVAAYATAVVAVALLQPTLGHDEAVYAVGARSLGGDDPEAASPFPVHRPIGMRLLAAAPYAAGGSDAAFRALGVLGTAAFLLALYALVRRLRLARGAAALAVATVATFPGVERRAYQCLTDLPSGALLLGALCLLLARPATRARQAGALAAAAALAVAAIYVRYGQLASAGAYALAWIAIARPWRSRGAAPLVVAAVVGAALLAPLVVYGHGRTGDAIGLFVRSRAMVADVPAGAGLVDYAVQWFGALAGPVGGALALAGVTFAVAERRRRRTAPRRERAALVAGSLLAVLVLGVAGHGEPRYIFVPVAVLAGLGVHGVLLRARRSRPAVRRRLALAVAVTFAGSTAYAAIVAHHDERNLGVMRAAARAIAADRAAAPPCRVLTGHPPVLEWYSGCRATPMPRALGREDATRRRLYVVTFDRGFRQRAIALDGVTCEPVAALPSRGGAIGGGAVCRVVPVR